jgi:PST family polysaccharide transporter
LRRIDDLARVSILSALVGAVVGILAIYLLGKDGVLWFVLTAPAVNFLVVSYYAARLPRPHVPSDLVAIQQQWLAMLNLGIPFMASGLLMSITQLAMRSLVLRDLGLEASGHFQAAWAISMTYLMFVLNAMVMDYYPRLAAAISDHQRAGKLVNEQAQMTLLMAGPLLLAMITLAPWVIHLLYAQGFGPAAEMLRWQMLGDILKVATTPIIFIFLAAGRGGAYIGIQFLWSAVYLGTFVLGIEEFGLVMAGVSFGIAYLVLYVVVAIVTNRLVGFKPTQRNWQFALLLLLAGASTIILAMQSAPAGYAIGALATLIVSAYSWRRLDHLIDLTGWLRQKVQ